MTFWATRRNLLIGKLYSIDSFIRPFLKVTFVGSSLFIDNWSCKRKDCKLCVGSPHMMLLEVGFGWAARSLQVELLFVSLSFDRVAYLIIMKLLWKCHRPISNGCFIKPLHFIRSFYFIASPPRLEFQTQKQYLMGAQGLCCRHGNLKMLAAPGSCNQPGCLPSNQFVLADLSLKCRNTTAAVKLRSLTTRSVKHKNLAANSCYYHRHDKLQKIPAVSLHLLLLKLSRLTSKPHSLISTEAFWSNACTTASSF